MRIASTPRSLFTPPPKAEGAAPSLDTQQVDAHPVEHEPHLEVIHAQGIDAPDPEARAHQQVLLAGINEATVLTLDPVKSGGGRFNEIARRMGYDPKTIGPSQRQAISIQFSLESGKSAGAGGPSYMDIVNGRGALETAMQKVLGAPR